MRCCLLSAPRCAKECIGLGAGLQGSLKGDGYKVVKLGSPGLQPSYVHISIRVRVFYRAGI